MTPPLERARQLIALATGATTPTEEARNAAMAAIRLIAREKLIEARGMWDVKPARHCEGCLCFSTTHCTCDRTGCRMHDRPDRGAPARPRQAPAPPPPRPAAADRTSEYDFGSEAFREPESVEQKRYREGWERVWGGNPPGPPPQPPKAKCTCHEAYISIGGQRVSGARIIDGRCPVHGSMGSR